MRGGEPLRIPVGVDDDRNLFHPNRQPLGAGGDRDRTWTLSDGYLSRRVEIHPYVLSTRGVLRLLPCPSTHPGGKSHDYPRGHRLFDRILFRQPYVVAILDAALRERKFVKTYASTLLVEAYVLCFALLRRRSDCVNEVVLVVRSFYVTSLVNLRFVHLHAEV